MPIEIYFRGVGMFVRSQDQKSVTEVLFPNAEGDTADKTVDGDGYPCHADHSRATHHFAGLLIPRLEGDEYHRLWGLEVTFLLSGDTQIDPSFCFAFPSISAATSGAGFGLKLSADRKPGGRVATRIVPSGGRLDPIPPSVNAPEFRIEGHFAANGKDIPPKRYSPGAKWTPTPPDLQSVQILLTDVSKLGRQPITITLGPDRPKAIFYNFDNGLPTEDQLVHEDYTAPCKGDRIDHDYKWLYGLMERSNPMCKNWKDWLGSQSFPAPLTPCPGVGLLPVSTCFQTVL